MVWPSYILRLRIRQMKKVIVSWLDVLNDPKQQMYKIYFKVDNISTKWCKFNRT